MRKSRFLAFTVCSLSLLAGLSLPGAVVAQAPGRAPVVLRLRHLKVMLEETLDFKDFQAPMTLKEALTLLQDKLNAKFKDDDVLPILIDAEAFEEGDPKATDVYDTQVKFPPFPRQMSVGAALRFVLSRIRTRNATFLLRGGIVEVTTVKQASLGRLLRQKVLGSFNRRPLTEVVEELSARTGVTVLFDVRLGDRLRMPVTASLNNDVTLEAALRLLADMAGLRLTLAEGAPYITSPEDAQRLEKAAAGRKPRAPELGKGGPAPVQPKVPAGK